MIFWDARKRYQMLRDMALVQCVFFHHHPRFSIFRLINRMGGKGFIQYVAKVYRNKILVYRHSPVKGKRNIVFDIPVVSEDAEVFPEQFAIRTKNIELLRDLLAQGKKVSWLEPDLFTQAHYLGLFDFEHVFLNHDLDDKLVLPDGSMGDTKMISYTPQGFPHVKGARKIGLDYQDVAFRTDYKDILKGMMIKYKRRLPIKMMNTDIKTAAYIYNIFSITYIIWRAGKLFATHAQKKSVMKG